MVERSDGDVRLLRADGLVEAELGQSGRVVDVVGNEWRLDPPADREAQPGDRVLILPSGDTAELVQVLSPDAGRIVGRLVAERSSAELEPFGRAGPRSMRIARDDRGGAVDGDVVEAVPARRGRSNQSWARVVRVLGRPGEADADFEALAWKHRLAVEFPPEVLREAKMARRRAEHPGKRLDLTALPFVTIDPASARDHDDAVCVAAVGRSDLKLWVAIADVAHFVEEGGAIEREAVRRGNSVYLPDRALPMLPEELSSEACSLVPNEERLVLVAELLVAADGSIREQLFHRAVIQSRARLAYEQAAVVMEGGTTDEVDSSLTGPLRALAEVAVRLGERRRAGATIDLELPEPSLVLDEERRVVASVRAARTVAHRAIEEAMLAANRAVASWLDARGVVTVHRVHEPPGEEALVSLAKLLARFDLLDDPRAELTPPRLVAALSAASGRPIQQLVHWSVLRSMQQARYATESIGHYALGFEHYLHFTSPIRRIADLVVHRVLHRELAGRPEPHNAREKAERVAVRASVRERVAQRVEREGRAIKQAALMQDRLGECFDGVVSGLTPSGVFVTLDEPFVDGRVDVEALGAGFELDADGLALVAGRSHRRIALGDPISVRVEGVDVFRGQIRFGPVRSAS